MARTYKVATWTYKASAGREKAGKVVRYEVTDQYDNETDEERPPVAVFQITSLYDAESQHLRATKLAEYLNSVNEKISVYATLSNTPIV